MDDVAHIPVLFQEALDQLAIKPDGVYVDATCGAGGHSQGILERLGKNGQLIAFDQDENALAIAKRRLERFSSQVHFVHENFSGIDRVLDLLNIESIDGALADLGVSSMQFDNLERGFSFESDVEIDMRMDCRAGQTAAELIRATKVKDLARILAKYGEQPMATRVANAIKKAADSDQALTGRTLRQTVHQALPKKFVAKSHIDPATRVFMALRIAVNDELAVLESFLEGAARKLHPGGRLVVISFHSLEDRIVKRFFRDQAKGCDCPKDLPQCICGKVPTLKVLTRKPVMPAEAELKMNPRARSSRLRAAERLP